MNINIKNKISGFSTRTYLNGERINLKQDKIKLWSIIKGFFNKKNDVLKIVVYEKDDLIKAWNRVILEITINY